MTTVSNGNQVREVARKKGVGFGRNRALGASFVVDRGEVKIPLWEQSRVKGYGIEITIVQSGVVVQKTSLLAPAVVEV